MSPRATAYPPGGRRKQRPVQARGRNPRPVPVPSTDQPATTPTPDCHRSLTFRKLMSLPRARGMRRPGHVEASMVTRDTAWPSGTPCWVDLGVDDIAKAGTFYAGLFGWEIQAGPPEAYGYAMCLTNGLAVAGIGPKQGPPGTPAAWTTSLASDDADQTSRKVKAAGGRVLMEPMDTMDVGRMAVAADPGGALVGIWQAGAPTGVGPADQRGGRGGRGRAWRRPVRHVAAPRAQRRRAGQRAGDALLERELQPRLRPQQGVLSGSFRLRIRGHRRYQLQLRHP